MNTDFPLTWAVKLIENLHMLYGSKFMQQWEGIEKPKLAQFWADELNGFTAPEIKKGLAACRERPFPPTLPEFMVLCRPPIRSDAAFHEAVYCLRQRQKGERGDWSHPAIFYATLKVGQYDMLGASYSQMRSRWDRALADELAKGEWEPIPDPTPALPEPARTQNSDAEAKKAMTRLGIEGVLDQSKRDPKAWARKILDNPKGRTPAVIEMARRALGEGAA